MPSALDLAEVETRVAALQIVQADLHIQKAAELFSKRPEEVTLLERQMAKAHGYFEMYSTPFGGREP